MLFNHKKKQTNVYYNMDILPNFQKKPMKNIKTHHIHMISHRKRQKDGCQKQGRREEITQR